MPDGLYNKYVVTKSNGDPVDPDAMYFVLRLDSGGSDLIHTAACREAARAYAQAVFDENPDDPNHLHLLASELAILVDELDKG